MRVLVTDGENRSALAVTRSLGRRGCSIYVVGSAPGNISASSRFCSKALTVPDPLRDSHAYSRAIVDLALREKIDIIFPMTEQSIYSINKVREVLGRTAVVACPSTEKMQSVSDKYKLFETAEKLGVAVPETVFVKGPQDFAVKRNGIRFPVVVKPALSKIEEEKRILSTKVMYAFDQDQLDHLYETVPALGYPSLIQELIRGEGTGLFTLFNDGRHLALFSHRRLLEKPPSGGVSVLSESIPLQADMVDAATTLLAAAGWGGVAMVEFKRDARDGKAKLIEINGRFWGSLQLAVSSGVDFPSLCLDYYLGISPASVRHYSEGYRLKWLFGILDHLIIRLKKRTGTAGTLPVLPPLRQVLLELIKTANPDTSFDVYDREDRRPFFSEAKKYFRSLSAGCR